jgi:hypothetical protein
MAPTWKASPMLSSESSFLSAASRALFRPTASSFPPVAASAFAAKKIEAGFEPSARFDLITSAACRKTAKILIFLNNNRKTAHAGRYNTSYRYGTKYLFFI